MITLKERQFTYQESEQLQQKIKQEQEKNPKKGESK